MKSLIEVGPSRGQIFWALLMAALAHGLISSMVLLGLPQSSQKRLADVTIELYAPPPTQAARLPEPTAAPQPQAQQPRPRVQQQQVKTPIRPADQADDAPTLSAATQPSVTTAQPPKESPSPAAPPPPPRQPSRQDSVATRDADYKAAYLKNPKPPYPAMAVRMRAQGRVVLLAEVLSDGRAGRVEVAESSGYSILDNTALDTVKTWRFTPARKDGLIVPQWVRIPIDFNLK